MKKITSKMAELRLGITLSLVLLILNIGYSESPYRTNDLLISFEPGTSQGYIDSLRLEYNAVEDFLISPSPVSKVHLWYIQGFPTGGSNNLNDINEVVGNARGKAEIKSAGLNYESKVFFIDIDGDVPDIIDPTYLCSNDFSITCEASNTVVRMSVLDTGIGFYEDQNGGLAFYSPDLFDPFYGSYLGYDFVNEDPLPEDDHSHGTHAAGLIAEIATMSSATTIEMESFKTHDSRGSGYIYNIVRAIDQSILNGINIINMSFSYEAQPLLNDIEPLEHAINVAEGYGILVVAAAGNDTRINDGETEASFPASFTCNNIISVASVDCNKELSSFSNWGYESVDITTLGEDLIAPDHFGFLVIKSGTSQATAMTSGIAGVLATNLNFFNWSPIKCSILDGAEYNPNLDTLVLTEGIVNANNAYIELMLDCGMGYRSAPFEEESELINKVEVTIHPNPFSESCSMKYNINSTETVAINIYNEMGQVVFNTEETLDKGTHIFNWAPGKSISTGIYFIQILTKDKEVTRKVVKQY